MTLPFTILSLLLMPITSIAYPLSQKTSAVVTPTELSQRLTAYWPAVSSSKASYMLYIKTIVQSLFLSRRFRAVYYGAKAKALPRFLKTVSLLPPATATLNPLELDFDELIISSSDLATHLVGNASLDIAEDLAPFLVGVVNCSAPTEMLTYAQAMEAIRVIFELYLEQPKMLVTLKPKPIWQLRALWLVTILPQWERFMKLPTDPIRFSPTHITLLVLLSIFTVAFFISIPFAVRYHYLKRVDDVGVQLLTKGQRVWLGKGSTRSTSSRTSSEVSTGTHR